MHIGCPREVKPQEFRVGLTPQAAHEAVRHGHQVTVETGAGTGAGFSDDDYAAAGARIAATAAEVWAGADLVIKVKEPQADELPLVQKGQILFTYLHLAPDPALTQALVASGATCIAYETVTDARGGLPLLAPMSEVAGRLAPQVGAWAMQKANGGCGVLLGGVPGVRPANVLIIGGGVVGTAAARVATGMSASVTVVDRSLARLSYLDDIFMGRLTTQFADAASIATLLPQADLVIGAVLVPGAATPRLVRREQLASMRAGSVMVDVAVDQGGCFETSRPTTHHDPIYEVDGVLHYCVSNMPGAVPRTSTLALGNATLPFLLALADKGWRQACADDIHLRHGLNIHAGRITCPAVAEAQGLAVHPADDLLAA
ncbi:MAG: alanine dehydrogenase [Rubellimicrobium sp.]|nr:alanine dehydrogenase [Rubellimicrobium sp.]